MKGGYIIASNHQSYTDPPLIAAVIRGKFSFIAKEELFKNPFFSFLIKRCGAFPVERGSGDEAPILKAIETLEKGRIFVIFPEGARSKDGTIGRMKSGVVLIASKAEAPVLPVCIRYKDKKHIDVNIGKMIPAEELRINEEDRSSMRNSANRLKNELLSLQQEIFSADGQEQQK